MLKSRITLLLFCLLFSFNQLIAKEIPFTPEEKEWIKRHQTVIYGYGYQFQPFQINENGVFKGIAPDFIELIEQKSGIKFIGKKYPTWDATYQAMKNKEVDVLPDLAYTDERAKYILFVKPHISHPLVIVTRKDYPFVGNLEAFQGKTMSLPKEYVSTESITATNHKINYLLTENVYQSLLDVSTGKADGTASDLPVISYFLYYQGFQNLKISATLSSMKDIELGFGVRKDYPELKSIIEKVLASISIQEKNRIFQKWISVKYDHGVNMEKVWFYSIACLLIGVFIIVLILLGNKRLKKEIDTRKETEIQLENSLRIIHKKNDEKQAMLKEIHHRVKNNLQIVSSLLRFQSNKIKDEKIISLFDEAQNRVISMAILHEKLYKSEDLKNIHVEEYFASLLEELMTNYNVSKEIKLQLNSEDIYLNSKTLAPLGLIINEVVTNSIKHAFPNEFDEKEKIIEVKFRREVKNNYVLEIGDNGIGSPRNILSGEITSMGAELISVFVEQLEGKIILLDKSGTYFQITFQEVIT